MGFCPVAVVLRTIRHKIAHDAESKQSYTNNTLDAQ
jgi:hypothetical protein